MPRSLRFLVCLTVLACSLRPPHVAARPHQGDGNCPDQACGLLGLAPPEVRDDFAAGVVALHDFWYEEAEARFLAVQRTAPAFTLGYWGEAMAQHRNPFGFTEPPLEAMRAALQKLGATREERLARAATDHARGYLAALEILLDPAGTPAERHPAYAEAMGELARAHPRDVETLAFHARAILLAAPTFGRSDEIRARTAAAASRALELEPDHHGGLHYLIHALDAPATWRGALDAADRYQGIAAGASHAVHMPSHIYMQAGMWDAVVTGNLAAVRTSEAWIRDTGLSMKDLDHHAVDFLIYAYLQQGREAEARTLLERARAHRAEFDTGSLRWHDALWSARYAAEVGARSEIPLPRSGYNSVGEVLGLGLHALSVGQPETASELLEEARARVEAGAAIVWRIAALELEAALDGGDRAVHLLREAILLQSELGRPNETPTLVKPPEELLGEILLARGEAADAAIVLRASERRWPGRLATRIALARAAEASGDTTAARSAFAGLLEQLRHAAPDHPARLEATRYLESTAASADPPIEPR